TADARRANSEALDAIVAGWTAMQDANAAAERLQSAGIGAHASWTTPEIAADPHLRQRHAIVEVSEPDGKRRAAVGVPMRLSKGAEIGIDRGTPKLGEHEDFVYGDLLGMSQAERRRLEEAEVIY
ncbi:MAG: CoA transferase, partial [Pigmentiphaga sp.]